MYSKRIEEFKFTKDQLKYIEEQIEKEIFLFQLPSLKQQTFIQLIKPEKDKLKKHERFRIAGSKLSKLIAKHKIESISLQTPENDKYLLSYAEGITLADYSFLKYKTKKEKTELKKLALISKKLSQKDVEYINSPQTKKLLDRINRIDWIFSVSPSTKKINIKYRMMNVEGW